MLTFILFVWISSIASVCGDYLQSKFKRSQNIKDSGNILPGHGGISDRVDSHIVCLPIFFSLIFVNKRMKKVLILGSTGSIGTSALEVIKGNVDFQTKSLVARKNKKLILEQAKEFNVSNIFLSEGVFSENEVKSNLDINFSNNLEELLSDKDIDIVIAAFSGLVGIKSILQSIKAGKKILIANKEPLVVAGKNSYRKLKNMVQL